MIWWILCSCKLRFFPMAPQKPLGNVKFIICTDELTSSKVRAFQDFFPSEIVDMAWILGTEN